MLKHIPTAAALVYAKAPAHRAAIHKAVKFRIEGPMAKAAYQLSLTDWHEWWDRVFPCYDDVFVEIDAQHLGPTEKGAPYALGWLWTKGSIHVFTAYEERKHHLFELPCVYQVQGDDTVLVIDKADLNAQMTGRAIGWGPVMYRERNGDVPPFGFAVHENLAVELRRRAGDFEQFTAVMMEFAGNARMAFACMAYINAMDIRTDEDRPHAKRLLHGVPVPGMVYKTLRIHVPPPVVIAPGGPAETAVSTPRREHGVRAHERRYKSGRVVIVRSHTRGSAELGSVVKDYVVR